MKSIFYSPSRALTQKTSGFSLLELGVVLTIISIVTGGLLSLTTVQDERNARLETKRRMDAIEAALQRYAYSGDSLPCPAPRNVPSSNALFGLSPTGGCTGAAPAGTVDAGTGNEAVNIGSVPTRTLNLPDSFIADGWGNRFSYAVIKQITPDRSLSGYSTIATNGVIQLVDGSAAVNQITEPCAATVNAYALVSHGKDGNGAFTRDGQSRICNASGRDAENCDGDITFTDTRPTEGTQGTLAYYDDMVRWKQTSTLQPLSNFSLSTSPVEEQRIDVTDLNIEGSTLAIAASRQLYSWGFKGYSNLGRFNGGDIPGFPLSLLPDISSAQKDWMYVVSAENANFGIRANGIAYSWGFNITGALGTCRTAFHTSTFPRMISGNVRWKKISAEYSNACGISFAGQLYCWGSNSNGVNAVPLVATNVPYRISANNDWYEIAATERFGCGLREGGRMFCWGSRGHYFGDGSNSIGIVGITPAATAFTDWKKVSIGGANGICSIRSDNSLYCWGGNTNGEAGLGTAVASYNTPQRVGTANDWMSIDHGREHACGVRAGTAFCWGNGVYGQLGDNSLTSKNAPSPVFGGYTDWLYVKGGWRHSCGMRANRTAWCWGRNTEYQLGDGTNTSPRQTPVQVQGVSF